MPYLAQQPGYSQVSMPILSNSQTFPQYSPAANSQFLLQAPQPRFLSDMPHFTDSYAHDWQLNNRRQSARKVRQPSHKHSHDSKTRHGVLKTKRRTWSNPRALELRKAVSTSTLSPRKTPDVDPKQKQLLLILEDYFLMQPL